MGSDRQGGIRLRQAGVATTDGVVVMAVLHAAGADEVRPICPRYVMVDGWLCPVVSYFRTHQHQAGERHGILVRLGQVGRGKEAGSG